MKMVQIFVPYVGLLVLCD